jgi:hypothetical protein
MNSSFSTFLLVLAATFPVVNPPGSDLARLSIISPLDGTKRTSCEFRRVRAFDRYREELAY